MPKISVVSPVYGCCASLNDLYDRLKESLSTISEDFEIFLSMMQVLMTHGIPSKP